MKILEIIVRIVIGGLFVFAGALKLVDPAAFLTAIESFQIVPYSVAYVTAFGLPWIEVWCGLAILGKDSSPGAKSILAGLLVFFIVLIATSWVRGLDINCGCFGKLFGDDTSYPVVLVRNFVLLVGLGFLLQRDTKSQRQITTDGPAKQISPESAS